MTTSSSSTSSLPLPPPPLTAKHQCGPTEYELKYTLGPGLCGTVSQPYTGFSARRLAERKHARRSELKSRPLEEQATAAARARVHQATYHENHRDELRKWEAERRIETYKKKYGPEAYAAYVKQKHERKRLARQKRRAKEAYVEYVDRNGNIIDNAYGPRIGRLLTD
ncbi:hypothetical protein B0H19DRAFT_1068555 [Mycena capillaripes]|nr:hypothetical protein B0H19DRAFT_1068555 [Mycena capillaripes]